MKLLAVGDIHLGRPPAALPPDLAHRARELGPEAAWKRVVEAAIEHEVNAVLLAGDVVDRGRDFFVAYGDLKSGIERLAASGIETIAVAGNHDTEVLPRLASEIESLHLLGAGGQWELRELDGAAVLGWSFPTVHVHDSPLATLEVPDTGLPVIGLLHCDLDQPGSRYAPVSRSELERAPTAAWLLGHIHQPDDLTATRPLGYLGSVTALRASETGARGPWLVEVKGSRVRARQLVLAPLRYEPLVIDAGELEAPERLFSVILSAARRRVAELGADGPLPDTLGLRVRLEGSTAFGRQLDEQARSLVKESRPFSESGLSVFIHRIETATLPALDLQALAEQASPVGLLARDLLALDEPDSDRRLELVRDARRPLEDVIESREFRALALELDDEAVAGRLRTAARLALTRLVEQHGGGE